MVKKICGSLLVVLALVLQGIGWFNMGKTAGQINAVNPQMHDVELDYSGQHEKWLMMGGALVAVGVILIIAGIVLIASRTRVNREY
jgi:uncharacterized membrane protein